jgi:esterase/lipase superfamily enzyme
VSSNVARREAAPYRLLLLALCFACVAGGGCASHVKLKPLPVVFQPGRADSIDLCSAIAEPQRTPDVPIFYATNRTPKGPADDRTYTNGVSKELRFGVANVAMGERGESWQDTCNGDATFRVERFAERDADAFVEAIDRQLATSPNRQVNIYVHGFKTYTEWETEVLAKLFHCSLRRGAMVCFAWPSRQSLYLYGQDVDRARASAPHLNELIELIATRTDAERINLLAYSCGAAMVSEALVELRGKYPDDDAAALGKRLRIGNVIFAASDIDLKTFAKRQLDQIRALAQHVVVYIAENDAALGMAKFGYGTSRLGRPDLKELELSQADLDRAMTDHQIQVVDVTDVPGPHSAGGFGGHGYWYANDWIMTDLLVDFRWQIPPNERGLVRRPGKARWYFPKDYPERVTAALRRRIAEQQATTKPEASSPPGPVGVQPTAE